MDRVCSDYQRLSRAYQRAFIAWGEPNGIDEDWAMEADLEAVENKYRLLAMHQQACDICSAELGQSVGKVQIKPLAKSHVQLTRRVAAISSQARSAAQCEPVHFPGLASPEGRSGEQVANRQL